MTTKEKVYLKDNIAGIIFNSPECTEYVASVISSAIGVDKEIVRDNLVLSSPRVNENINTQYSMVDAIYENNTSIINIEINYNKSRNLQNKNLKYVCNLILKQTKPGKRINLKPIYQININNFDIFGDNEFLSRSYIMNEKNHMVRDKSISIIDINLDYLSKLSYNKIKEEPRDSLEYLLYIFVNDNKKELERLYLEDEVMENVQEKLYTLTEALDSLLYYDPEELRKRSII